MVLVPECLKSIWLHITIWLLLVIACIFNAETQDRIRLEGVHIMSKWSTKKKVLTILGRLLSALFLYRLFVTKVLGWQEIVTGTISAIWRKVVTFVAGLTLGKVLFIGVKRWFIDHTISKLIREQLIPHMIEPSIYWWQNLSGKQKAAMFLSCLSG